MGALFVGIVAGLGLLVLGAGCSRDGGGAGSGGTGGKGTGASTSAGGSSAKDKAFAECCASDSECASGVCSPKHLACSVACTKDEDCPPEPKSGIPSCSTTRGVCQAESSDVTCEPHTASGGQAGSGGANGTGGSGASSSGGRSGSGGTGAGGSGAGGAQSGAPHVVQCSQITTKEPFNNGISSDICRCRSADANAGMTSYRGDQACGQGDADLFCCGDSGYPDSGSCTCYQKRTWQCFEGGGGGSAFCQCWYYGSKATAASQVPTSSCDLSTKSYATRCYVFDVTGGQRCQCDARALPAGAREVPGCSTADDAAVTVQTECPADKTTVDTCSQNLYVPPSGGGCGPACSGTMCVGDSLCCSYSCDGDTCAQHCNF
jgi:hypothetical protein